MFELVEMGLYLQQLIIAHEERRLSKHDSKVPKVPKDWAKFGQLLTLNPPFRLEPVAAQPNKHSHSIRRVRISANGSFTSADTLKTGQRVQKQF